MSEKEKTVTLSLSGRKGMRDGGFHGDLNNIHSSDGKWVTGMAITPGFRTPDPIRSHPHLAMNTYYLSGGHGRAPVGREGSYPLTPAGIERAQRFMDDWKFPVKLRLHGRHVVVKLVGKQTLHIEKFEDTDVRVDYSKEKFAFYTR
jgi:hypothetical protein